MHRHWRWESSKTRLAVTTPAKTRTVDWLTSSINRTFGVVRLRRCLGGLGGEIVSHPPSKRQHWFLRARRDSDLSHLSTLQHNESDDLSSAITIIVCDFVRECHEMTS
ncbi:hypothetical protein ABZX51_000861 [Aspergillus tubingensis]